MSDKKIYELDESTSPALTSEVPVSTGTGVNDTKRVALSNLGWKELFYTASTPTATTNPALWINSTTGELKVWNGSSWTSKNYLDYADTIPLASLSNQSQSTILGRASGAGTGSVTALTATQVRTLLNVADGANAYVHPNHTGDVTSTADGATAIASNAVTTAKLPDATGGSDGVTNAKLAWMAANTIKGNQTASTAVSTNITVAANKILGRSSSGNIAAKDCTDKSFTLLSQSTNEDWLTSLQIDSCQRVLSAADGIDFNSTGDQGLTFPTIASASGIILTGILVTNCGTSLTTAAGGVYDAVGKGGNVIVAASQAYTTITGSSKYMTMTLAAYGAATVFSSGQTIYLSLTTPQGGAATATVMLLGYPIYL